ncbi:coagulation factor 5/8 type domain-containing protein [Granulicella sp. S156]|uniref:coagulation factor 5/8 type domain-containing protein n=1 Tax=Granulicella sp. S156 TaxID=1747224 RepID=UPI0020B12D78|nr:coagulation factor 5/8 type domain-containing protein [Granulicella sp. S156]
MSKLTGVGLLLGMFAGVSVSVIAQQPTPDFGPNVQVFSPSMLPKDIQAQIDKVYAVQQRNEFGPERNALLFLPGEYKVDVPIGFYTEAIGLGASPDDVRIAGDVHAEPVRGTNATVTFWRTAEGFSVTPAGGTMRWAVSQAAPFRRMHIHGDMVLHKNGGWASGGWMSDDLIDGTVNAGPQQQWIARNSEWQKWTGSNWNMVFVGLVGAPEGEWPKPPFTKIAQTPVVREKPFLQVDAKGNYSVRVPQLRRNSEGITWRAGVTPGKTIPLNEFYIARADRDTAATINAQLAKGKHLLLTPGIYELSEALHVTRADTVVMGLGFATLRPTQGNAAMTTADADGIIIAGLLFDAGATKSPVLLEVGPAGSKTRHRNNPISLHDVFFRVGGAAVGRTDSNLTINSNDTIVDHTWIWRADHGTGVGWDKNLSANGLIVNGNDVTVYGLFVEHHQEYQVLWNGNRGRTYFYQSEIPYDPPNQTSYTSAPGVNGWASYKVADNVTAHEAWGLGIYSVFTKPSVTLSHAIEVPEKPGVRFHHMITVALGKLGEISNVINKTGGATATDPRVTPKVTNYP